MNHKGIKPSGEGISSGLNERDHHRFLRAKIIDSDRLTAENTVKRTAARIYRFDKKGLEARTNPLLAKLPNDNYYAQAGNLSLEV